MLRSTIALASACCLLLPACDGGSQGGPRPSGLVFALTTLDANLLPQPGGFLIVKPKGKPSEAWDVERVEAPSDAYTAAVGRDGAGKVYLADIGPDGQPTGQPFQWAREQGRWVKRAAEGVALESLGFTKPDGKLRISPYQLGHGNVVHKAAWFTPRTGQPGILTVSGNLGCLDLWRRVDGAWKPETLWADAVGSENQRLREFELGDVTGDGVEDIVIATHDTGGIYVVQQTEQGYTGQRIASHPELGFVHEIELGDVDGDGLLEIFATPSMPNKVDGSHQRGEIHRYDFEGGNYTLTVIEDNPKTHAKEILCTDLEGDGRLELYAVMEGEALSDLNSSEVAGSGTHIKRYDFEGQQHTSSVLCELPGNLCRFLVPADLQGDGRRELVASTMADGVWEISRPADVSSSSYWQAKRLLGGLVSGGFEHCTLALDWDGDGADELYLGSDKFLRLNRVVWDKQQGRPVKTVMAELSHLGTYLTWNIGALPQGF
jgi:hypothetical protein